MSAAPVPVDPLAEAEAAARALEQRKLDRLLTLMAWLRDLGVCACCRVAFALRQVEREHDGPPLAPVTCDHRDRHGMTCRELAVAAWKNMPAAGSAP